MKVFKKIYIGILALCSVSFAFALSNNNTDRSQISLRTERSSVHQEHHAGYTHGQCQAIAKSTGKRCRRGVSNSGDSRCYQHK